MYEHPSYVHVSEKYVGTWCQLVVCIAHLQFDPECVLLAW